MAALAALALAIPAAVRAAAAEPAAKVYDWGVAYYMPYDNDLEGAGERIIKAIRKGVTSGRTVVAVQADFADVGGMRRITVKSSGTSESRVASDDSADPDQLVAYLEWFAKTFRCKRYAVVIMNHGGGLDEMCLDDLPETPGRNWMSGAALGRKLREFKKKMPGRWELLFLQQCGRGSIENLYSFRGTAEFVMSSPLRIAAPNTYYVPLHEFLARNPKATGDQLAEVIGREDRHFRIFTCVRARKLEELPTRLDAMLKPFIKEGKLINIPRPAAVYKGKVGKRPMIDAKTYFYRLAEANGTGRPEVSAFFGWVRRELITRIWLQEGAAGGASQLCGLSLYVPATPGEARACTGLDIYGKTRLAALWKRLAALPPVTSTAAKTRSTPEKVKAFAALRDHSWTLLAAAAGGKLDAEALTRLQGAWKSPWTAELLKGTGSSVAFRSLWAISESSKALPRESALAALAGSARKTAGKPAREALRDLQDWPEDARAFVSVLYAALAFRDEEAFLAGARPLLLTNKVHNSPLSSARTVTAALLAPPGKVDGKALTELLSKGAASVTGDDMVILTALACRRAGGKSWQAFAAASGKMLARGRLSGSVVTTVKHLAEPRLPIAAPSRK